MELLLGLAMAASMDAEASMLDITIRLEILEDPPFMLND